MIWTIRLLICTYCMWELSVITNMLAVEIHLVLKMYSTLHVHTRTYMRRQVGWLTLYIHVHVYPQTTCSGNWVLQEPRPCVSCLFILCPHSPNKTHAQYTYHDDESRMDHWIYCVIYVGVQQWSDKTRKMYKQHTNTAEALGGPSFTTENVQ